MTKMKPLVVIDDDPVFVFVLKKMLLQMAYDSEVLHFSNGLDAINYFIENDKNSNVVVFLDLNMPSIDGWQFLDEYAQLKISTSHQIYLISSSIDPREIEKARSHKLITEFYSKPITVKILKELL